HGRFLSAPMPAPRRRCAPRRPPRTPLIESWSSDRSTRSAASSRTASLAFMPGTSARSAQPSDSYMALFKFRKAADEAPPSPRQAESVEAMRRRARHRLIGAVVLILVGVIGFPLLFDTQPRPIAVDIPIEIPDRNKVKPLPLPPAVQAPTATGKVAAVPAAPTPAAPAPVPETQAAAPAAKPAPPVVAAPAEPAA